MAKVSPGPSVHFDYKKVNPVVSYSRVVHDTEKKYNSHMEFNNQNLLPSTSVNGSTVTGPDTDWLSSKQRL